MTQRIKKKLSKQGVLKIFTIGQLFVYKTPFALGGILILRRQAKGGRGLPECLRLSTRGEGGSRSNLRR